MGRCCGGVWPRTLRGPAPGRPRRTAFRWSGSRRRLRRRRQPPLLLLLQWLPGPDRRLRPRLRDGRTPPPSHRHQGKAQGLQRPRSRPRQPPRRDRKSTRLNSSHLVISYAVFCLKKKKHKHVTLVVAVDVLDLAAVEVDGLDVVGGAVALVHDRVLGHVAQLEINIGTHIPESVMS